MSHRFKRLLNLSLKAVLAFGLIAYLVHIKALDFDAISKLLSPGFIALTLGLNFLTIAINNYRWMLLLRAQGFPVSFKTSMPLTLIGVFFNFAMPGGVGGDVIKGYYLLREHPERRVAAALSIFMDRMSGFFIMLVTAMIALAANWNEVIGNPRYEAVGAAVAALFFAFLVFYGVSLAPSVGESRWLKEGFRILPGGRVAERIYQGLHSYRSMKIALIKSFLWSALSQVALIGTHVVVGHALGLDIPLSVYLFVVPVGTVVTTLPISIAGIGVGQAAFFLLYKMSLGSESQLGPTAATSAQIAMFAFGLIGAVFYLRRRASEPSKDSAKDSAKDSGANVDQGQSLHPQKAALRRS